MLDILNAIEPICNFRDLFDTNVNTNEWCIPKFNNVLETKDGYVVEIGIYKEENGSLTLQIFKNDDVVVCETIVW